MIRERLQRHAADWPLQRVFSAAIVAAAAGNLTFFALLSSFLVAKIVRRSMGESLSSSQQLFADGISNDILTGRDSEAYRKCKLYFNGGGLDFLEIRDPADRRICSFGKMPESRRSLLTLRTPIHFDQEKAQLAAIVEASYRDDASRRILRESFLALLGALLGLFVLLGFFVRFLGRALVAPVRRLSEILESRDLRRIREYVSDAPRSPIREIRVLYGAASEMALGLAEYEAERIKKSRDEAIAKVASQVAHDIRSPLVALDSILGSLSQIPEQNRLLVRGAVTRIRDIANELMETHRQAAGVSAAPQAVAPQPELVWPQIDAIVSEKRSRYRGSPRVKIEAEAGEGSHLSFALARRSEFKRALSNLIDNGVEALDGAGTVSVSLNTVARSVIVTVRDTGRGMSADILSRIGTRGATFKKEGGSGLGLSHAISSVESWGGKVSIESSDGHGTTVTLHLASASAPAWMTSSIQIDKDQPIVAVDDDPGIISLWRERFSAYSIQTLSNPEELRLWLNANGAVAGRTLFLLDYEFIGSELTGLSATRSFGIGDQTILVTSRFEEAAIVEEVRMLGARLLPKTLAPFVPISTRPSAILLDDDPLVRAVWIAAAKEQGLTLNAFYSPDDLMACLETIPKDTHFYLDVDLGNGLRGDAVAGELHSRGYKRLTLTTGYDAGRFSSLPWIDRVIGKEPPW